MIRKFIAVLLMSSLQLCVCIEGNAQTSTKTIMLKRGEVLDILLLSQHANVEEERNTYFQTAFPIAKSMSYQPLPGFTITDHTKGNHRPSHLIFGKWADINQRELFLTEVIKEIPDFHEQRRKIWSFFGMCYFSMKDDISFDIDRNKYHVATAYWLKDKKSLSAFRHERTRELKESNANIVLELQEGTSPFGYLYNPDLIVITAWENQNDFISFQKNTNAIIHQDIAHINEYILE